MKRVRSPNQDNGERTNPASGTLFSSPLRGVNALEILPSWQLYTLHVFLFFYTPQGGLKRVAKVQEQGTKNWGWLSREVHIGEGKYATPSINILVQETDKGQDR